MQNLIQIIMLRAYNNTIVNHRERVLLLTCGTGNVRSQRDATFIGVDL
jgi:hypothetical protein